MSRHPEIDFLFHDLPKLVRPNLTLLPAITLDVLRGQHRSFFHDVTGLTRSLETPIFLGAENIPLRNNPLIVVCNHPDIKDLVLGVVFLSAKFGEERAAAHQGSEIHWIIAGNFPRRGRNGPLVNALAGSVNFLLPRFGATYGFISVPIGERSCRLLARGKSLKNAVDVLRSDTPTVGIFPEGEIEFDGRTKPFWGGVKKMVEISQRDDLTVLPVGLYQNKERKLVVDFGEVIQGKELFFPTFYQTLSSRISRKNFPRE